MVVSVSVDSRGDKTVVKPPHEQLRRRRRPHKPRQICLLGENEHIGIVRYKYVLVFFINKNLCGSQL